MATNKCYVIEIVLDKEEISTEFQVICYKEKFKGNKRNAIKRARELQKEWNAEYYRVIKVFENEIDEFGRLIQPYKCNDRD